MDRFEFSLNQTVDSAELDSLFRASWPEHNDADHTLALDRALAFIFARQAGQLVGYLGRITGVPTRLQATGSPASAYLTNVNTGR